MNGWDKWTSWESKRERVSDRQKTKITEKVEGRSSPQILHSSCVHLHDCARLTDKPTSQMADGISLCLMDQLWMAEWRLRESTIRRTIDWFNLVIILVIVIPRTVSRKKIANDTSVCLPHSWCLSVYTKLEPITRNFTLACFFFTCY